MSSVEKILSGDQIYVLMDRPSRAYYRSCIERIADKLEAAEAAGCKTGARPCLQGRWQGFPCGVLSASRLSRGRKSI